MLETAELWKHWELPLLPLISVSTAAALYVRGWLAARHTRPHELAPWRAACFLSGLLIFWLAIASPLAALDDTLLTAHMFQHFLLMSVAPPLIVLGAPTVPMLRGLPRAVTQHALRPLLASSWLRSAGRSIMHPATVWVAMNVAYLGWHAPAAFELTFASEKIHDLEHAIFFFTSTAFWWIVIAPWPSHRVWPRWAMIPYLLLSDVLNTVLCALLAFCGRVVYPSYAAAPRTTHLTALQDQVAAGCEMWVLNSTIFLTFAAYLTVKALSPSGGSSLSRRPNSNRHATPVESSSLAEG